MSCTTERYFMNKQMMLLGMCLSLCVYTTYYASQKQQHKSVRELADAAQAKLELMQQEIFKEWQTEKAKTKKQSDTTNKNDIYFEQKKSEK
jgi:hypothetical protein